MITFSVTELEFLEKSSDKINALSKQRKNMKIIILLILIMIIILIFKKYNNKQSDNEITLKEIVKKTFPKYRIIEKNQTIMICEYSHRNEPEELVFIRIKPNEPKNIRKSGRILIANYPRNPDQKELKRDFRQHL